METQKKHEISPEQAYRICLRFLAPRPRSVAEIRRHLMKKEISPQLIDSTLEKLMKEKLLNDMDFARMFVESRERHKPRSRFALACELRQKGINEEIIEKRVACVDENTSAWNAVQPKIRTWQHLAPEPFKKKLFNFLRYRGFGYEIALSTWDRILSERGKTS